MADVITRLKVDSKEYDDKIKRAAQGLTNLEQSLRNTGKSFTDVDKSVVDYVRQLGSMQTASTTAKGKIGEMGNAFTELSLVYKRMTDQEKASPVGQAMAQSLEQLRGRTIEAKNELSQLNKQLTDNSTVTEAAAGDNMNFDSVLQSLGSQFGINTNLLSGLTSGTLATTAAITAGIGAVVAATKAWIDYNDQLNRQNTVTTVTTGLSGKEADDLTLGMRALSNTYDVDFREAINAANTLIQQFGVSGSEALSLIQDGMQGMISGDGGKLLSMIQQYAPSFRDAGIEASQLVAIIQNSEGGLFTDQNMSAIAMGIRNIRRMTDDTRTSLKELGIDADGMASKLEDGTMNVFEALREVSTALDNVGSGSKQAGDVMQAVFGRSGFMAGTKLGEAIAQLNTNLEETKKQTGELGESFARLNDANLRLEQTMQDIFGMTGWEDMNNLLKTDLANTLNDVLTFMGDIKTSITEIGTSQGFNALCDVLDTLVIPKLMGVTNMMKNIKVFMDGLNGNGGGGLSEGNGQIGGGVAGLISSGKSKGFRVTTDNNGKVIGATRDGQDVLAEYLATIAKNAPQPTTTASKVSGGGKTAPSWAPIAMQDLGMVSLGRSVNDINADMSKATRSYNESGDEIGRAAAKVLVEKFKSELDGMKNEGDVTKGEMNDAYTRDFRKELKGTEYDLANVTTGTERMVRKRNAMSTAQTALGGVSQITGGLQQMGVKLPDELHKVVSGMQGLMSVIQGVQSIMSLVQIPQTVAQIATENANTAAMVGLTAAVVANTSAVSVNSAMSILPFARGGIVHAASGYAVPGNFGYDAVPSLLTSGELVLNRAQQGNLASQLEGARGAQASGASTPYLRGEDIWLGVNNFLRRTGRGEIVTSKR